MKERTTFIAPTSFRSRPLTGESAVYKPECFGVEISAKPDYPLVNEKDLVQWPIFHSTKLQSYDSSIFVVCDNVEEIKLALSPSTSNVRRCNNHHEVLTFTKPLLQGRAESCARH